MHALDEVRVGFILIVGSGVGDTNDDKDAVGHVT
jgi:hypothetical protein